MAIAPAAARGFGQETFVALKALNFLLYYVAWFACVLSMGSADRWWWGVLGTLVAVTWQLCVSENRRRDVLAIVCAVSIGPVVDIGLLAAGAVRFPASAPQLFGVLPPLAMILLWAVFATTFFSSLSWIVSRMSWLIPAAAVGGPAAYYAGAQLVDGIVLSPSTPLGLIMVGLGWALVLPVVILATTRTAVIISAVSARGSVAVS